MAAPKLRFKEFDQIWDNLKYKDVLTIKYGKDHKLLNEGEFPVYGTGGVMRYADQYLHDGESILIGRKGTIDQPKYVNEKFWTVDTLFYTQIKDNSIPLFLYQHALQVNWLGLNEATGVPSLNTTSINNVDIALPSKEEQTKIATFLSAVDEKISQLTQKHALLSQYKQGMMQKLFSQQIRFKADDGCEFGDWRKVKFSESFVFHNTNSYSRALLAEVGEVMNIHYGDIHTKFSMLFDVSKEIVPFLNDQIDFTKIAENQFLKEGDLVIADASEDYKDIGKAIEVVHLNNQKVVAGLHTYIARPVQPFALGFCGYLMQTFEVREQIKKLATGISVLGISKTNIGKVEIKLPCLEEQTKIANFLSSIDQKIDVVSEQLEQAKLWKKGLLQQMFV